MASRYWVGGTGTWDAANTANWSTTSGGAGGASVPTSADDVFLDANSGAGVVTVGATILMRNIDTTGFTGTFTGAGVSRNIRIFGGVTWGASMTMGSFVNSTFTFEAPSDNGGLGWPIISNGKSFNAINFSSTTGKWKLLDALTVPASCTLSSGWLDVNGMSVSVTGTFGATTTTARRLTLGNANLTLGALVFRAGTLTCDANTATATITGVSALDDNSIGGADYNGLSVVLTAAGIPRIGPGSGGATKIKNLTRVTTVLTDELMIGGGVQVLGDLTITGLSETAKTRVFSGTVGTGAALPGVLAPIIVEGAVNVQDCDLTDVQVIRPGTLDVATRTNKLTETFSVDGEWDATRWIADPGQSEVLGGVGRLTTIVNGEVTITANVPPIKDIDFQVDMLNNSGSGVDQRHTRWRVLDASNYFQVGDSGGVSRIWAVVGGVSTVLITLSILNPSVRIQHVGNYLRYKVWTPGTPEPAAWDGYILTTNSLNRAGNFQLYGSRGGLSTTYTFDNIRIDSIDDYRVDLSAQRVGDALGNEGIKFADSVVCTYSDPASTNIQRTWETLANWSPRFPLVHDDVQIGVLGGGTWTALNINQLRVARNVDFTNLPTGKSVAFAASPGSRFYGSMTLRTGLAITGGGAHFWGRGAHTILFRGGSIVMTPNRSFTFGEAIAGTGTGLGEYTLLDAGTFGQATSSAQSTVINNRLNLGGFTHNISVGSANQFFVQPSGVLDFGGGGGINLSLPTTAGLNGFTINIGAVVLNAENSFVRITTNPTVSKTLNFGGFEYGEIDLSAMVGNMVTLAGDNKIGILRARGENTLKFSAGTVTSIGEFDIQGTSAAAPKPLESSTAGIPAFIFKERGSLEVSYCTIRDLQLTSVTQRSVGQALTGTTPSTTHERRPMPGRKMVALVKGSTSGATAHTMPAGWTRVAFFDSSTNVGSAGSGTSVWVRTAEENEPLTVTATAPSSTSTYLIIFVGNFGDLEQGVASATTVGSMTITSPVLPVPSEKLVFAFVAAEASMVSPTFNDDDYGPTIATGLAAAIVEASSDESFTATWTTNNRRAIAGLLRFPKGKEGHLIAYGSTDRGNNRGWNFSGGWIKVIDEGVIKRKMVEDINGDPVLLRKAGGALVTA